MFKVLDKPSVASLVVRLGLGAVVLYHGVTKLLVYPGGVGWDNTLPPWLQSTVAWVELVGGILLVVGLLPRLAALAIAVLQVGAIVTVTGTHGLGFSGDIGAGMKATPFNFAETGPQLNFTLIVLCVAVLVLGGGALSLNRLLWRRRGRVEAAGKVLQTTV